MVFKVPQSFCNVDLEFADGAVRGVGVEEWEDLTTFRAALEWVDQYVSEIDCEINTTKTIR